MWGRSRPHTDSSPALARRGHCVSNSLFRECASPERASQRFPAYRNRYHLRPPRLRQWRDCHQSRDRRGGFPSRHEADGPKRLHSKRTATRVRIGRTTGWRNCLAGRFAQGSGNLLQGPFQQAAAGHRQLDRAANAAFRKGVLWRAAVAGVTAAAAFPTPSARAIGVALDCRCARYVPGR